MPLCIGMSQKWIFVERDGLEPNTKKSFLAGINPVWWWLSLPLWSKESRVRVAAGYCRASSWAKFCWRRANAGTNFDLSTGRLAGGKHAEELWPLKRSIERGSPTGISIRRRRIGRMRGVLWPGIWLEFFTMGKWLGIAYFLHLFFLLDMYFPATSRRRIEQLSPSESEPTLSVPDLGTGRNTMLSDHRKRNVAAPNCQCYPAVCLQSFNGRCIMLIDSHRFWEEFYAMYCRQLWCLDRAWRRDREKL